MAKKYNFTLLNNLLQEFVDSGEIPGCSMAVFKDGQEVFHSHHGYADIASKRPLGDDAIFRIASMSKAITCTAAMKLYEQGKFKLYDPVYEYIPSFKNMTVIRTDEDGRVKTENVTSDMTIRNLFTMTSGISYGGDSGESARAMKKMTERAQRSAKAGKPWNTTKMISEAGKVPLAFQPGERWMYGFSHDVLGGVIEAISGKTFGEFVRQEILEPLGMADTGFYVPEAKLSRLATMYAKSENPLKPMDVPENITTPPAFESGGGGLTSSLHDYSQFAQMLLNGGEFNGQRILGRKTIEMMATDHLTPAQQATHNWATQRGYGYGLGFRVMVEPGVSDNSASLGEFGWDGAFGNWFCIDPKENLCAVYFVQILPGAHYTFIPRIMASMYAAL